MSYIGCIDFVHMFMLYMLLYFVHMLLYFVCAGQIRSLAFMVVSRKSQFRGKGLNQQEILLQGFNLEERANKQERVNQQEFLVRCFCAIILNSLI